jgi:hypothetical protein
MGATKLSLLLFYFANRNRKSIFSAAILFLAIGWGLVVIYQSIIGLTVSILAFAIIMFLTILWLFMKVAKH